MAVDKLMGGLYRLQFWLRDSTGAYMIGSGTSLSNGATSNAIVIDSVNATDAQSRALTPLEFQGGDRIIGTMQFGDTSFAPFTVTLDSADADHIALLHGTTVDSTTNSEMPMHTLFTDGATIRSVGMMLTQRKINRDGSDGGTGFVHYVFPYTQVLVRKTIGGFQAKTQVIWTVTPQLATKTPHGTSFSGLGMGVSEMDSYIIESTNPLHWTVFRSDAAATTFTPTYKAVSSTVTLAGTPNYMAKNGTATALSSVNTSTGLMTLSAAGTAGDYHVVLYETNFVTTS